MYLNRLTKEAVSRFDYPVVDTEYGKLRGIEREGGFVFRGIKYADAKRFQMPTEPTVWAGVRDAVNYGYACPEMKKPSIQDNIINPHFWQVQDENCQYLNIWTPTLDRSAKKTVMIWIHGGGWSTGSSQELMAYDAENLSHLGDVVVVSVNHRLNCLGYLDLSLFGDKYKDSVMVGLGDLVAALKWVHENIEAFGGDPENVMIFGQSGGGSKVLYLMQTPAADGLYHRACVQSGGAVYSVAPKGWTLKAISQRVGELTVKELGLDRDTVSEIDAVPYEKLASAASAAEVRILQETGMKRYRWEPIGDEEYCFGSPVMNDFRRETLDIPLIMGSVFSEHSSNFFQQSERISKNDWPEEKVNSCVREKYGKYADELMTAFQSAYPEKNPVDLLFIDPRDRGEMLRLMAKRNAAGGKVWNYVFTFESSFNGGTTAWHCSDLPFVFHNADRFEASYIPGVSERLQDQMMGAWVAFAKNGDPNCDMLEEWPAVSEDGIYTMIFDKNCRVAKDHDKELWALLDSARNETK